MEFRDRKRCTLEGVVFNSWAIHSSPRPSSTQRRILDACGFSATLLFSKAPFSSERSSFIVHMYHFLLPDARYVTTIPEDPSHPAASAAIQSTTRPRALQQTVRSQLDATRKRWE